MRKNTPEKIVDKDNHGFDAVRYLLMSHPPGPDRSQVWSNMSREQKVRTSYRPDREEYLDPVLGEL